MSEEMKRTEHANPKTIESEVDFLVPDRTNVLINDISASSAWIDICTNLLIPELIVFNPSSLSRILEMSAVKFDKELADQNVAVLYPKIGGLKVKDTLNINSTLSKSTIDEFEVESRRSKPNTAPDVQLPEKFIEGVKGRSYDSIVIIDDVVVTGSTMSAVRNTTHFETEEIDDSSYNPSLRFGWSEIRITSTPLKWYGFSWMAASREEQTNTLRGFEKIRVGMSYKGESGQPAVNSISTWVNDTIKGQAVLEAYAKKYAKDTEKFIRFIKNTKGGEE